MKKQCAIFTNIAPLYSKSLWYELASSKNVEYTFYSSCIGFSGIKTIDINESRFVNLKGTLNWLFLKNFYLRNILIYQSGIISKCLKTNYDAYILYGEMHSISNWIAALICKIRKKPLLIWGHGLYGDEGLIKKNLRIMYYKIADYHLVYGNRSRSIMVASGFRPDKIFAVYNSLDFCTHKKIFEERNQEDLEKLKRKMFPDQFELPVVIFIGRLTKEKKISYLIEAINICQKRGHNYNCLIVGGGDELSNLHTLSDSLGISDLVHFYGSSYDENLNAKLIMLSDCCVSPGNVGLTAIHSLSFGTPVITHENFFNQGPEVEAVIQDKTGLFFQENNITSLSDVIDNMILNKKKLLMESNCIEQVKRYWNPLNQRTIFDESVLYSIKTSYV
jgi:glycosyltransferase involved in cell wall biosynthesis